jgi:predicted enzyme related to lactoylglutathione lyase
MRRTAMRTMILAVTAALTLGTGQLQADPPKPLPADVGPGRIAWFDLTTSNLQQAREFYGKLFDWEFSPVKGTDLAVEIVSRGTAIGTLRGAEGKISAFNGVVYVQVTDLQASCGRAKELGGTVPPGFPFNLPDGIGAIALVLDPSGHPIGLYSRTPLPPAASPGK